MPDEATTDALDSLTPLDDAAMANLPFEDSATEEEDDLSAEVANEIDNGHPAFELSHLDEIE